jgi:hypothetical protein
MSTGTDYELIERDGWDDLLAPITTAKVPAVGAPTWSAFGPSGNLYAYSFAKGDAVYLNFHILHRMAPGGLMHPHVHWATDGTDTGTVVWDVEYAFSKGHNQEAYGAPTTITLSEAASGTAWQHMITETDDSTEILTPEPDTVIIVRLSRKNDASDTCTDNVFGLFMDWHYQIDRNSTPKRAPDFYEYGYRRKNKT